MLLCFYATLSYIVWPCVPLCHRPASGLAVGLATRVCVSSGDVCGTAADLMSLGSLLVSNLGAITRLWKVGCEVLARRSPQTARAGMSRGGRRGRGLTVTGSEIRGFYPASAMSTMRVDPGRGSPAERWPKIRGGRFSRIQEGSSGRPRSTLKPTRRAEQ